MGFLVTRVEDGLGLEVGFFVVGLMGFFVVVGFLVLLIGLSVSSTSLVVVVTISTFSVVVAFLGGNLVTVGVLTVTGDVELGLKDVVLEGVLTTMVLVTLR